MFFPENRIRGDSRRAATHCNTRALESPHLKKPDVSHFFPRTKTFELLTCHLPLTCPGLQAIQTMTDAEPAAPDLEPSWEAFLLVQKNRNSCIHYLLQLAQRIEINWRNEAARLERLELLKRCLELCQQHKHEDVREMGALAVRICRGSTPAVAIACAAFAIARACSD